MSSSSASLGATATAFAKSYASLFCSSRTLRPSEFASLADEIASYYRPGIRVFCFGESETFETREEASLRIREHLHSNASAGKRIRLIFVDVIRCVERGPLHAIVHIMWKVEVEVDGDGGKRWQKTKWEFANIYSYKADYDGLGAGFYLLVRDFRVPRMLNAHREPEKGKGMEAETEQVVTQMAGTDKVGTQMDFIF